MGANGSDCTTLQIPPIGLSDMHYTYLLTPTSEDKEEQDTHLQNEKNTTKHWINKYLGISDIPKSDIVWKELIIDRPLIGKDTTKFICTAKVTSCILRNEGNSK